MCDTFVALGNVTVDGATILAKNSDREPNEAHHLLRVPAAQHSPGSTVQCTYIEIPQVAQTFEVLLPKPFWMWGAEMGANEHGVAIGNEAVFTKVPYAEEPGLIGMDLLRLALERARTARQALGVIVDLLETYGQGGNCGFEHPSFYHNSFLIADPEDAWTLQTAGPHWAAEQVKDIYTISNAITIGGRWDLASDDLVNYAVDKKWCKGRDDFDFGRCYSDFLYTTFSAARRRQCRTTDLLRAQAGNISVEAAARVLRDHGADAGPRWSPAQGLTGMSVCAHVAFGPIRAYQTTGSMVSHLHRDVHTHYVTGTAAPCTSIFKPVWLGAELPDIGPVPAGTYDEATLFWRHEALHRATLRDYATRIALYQVERDMLERRFIKEAQACADGTPTERAACAAACFDAADRAEAEWTERVSRVDVAQRPGFLYRFTWRKFNERAGVLTPGVTE